MQGCKNRRRSRALGGDSGHHAHPRPPPCQVQAEAEAQHGMAERCRRRCKDLVASGRVHS